MSSLQETAFDYEEAAWLRSRSCLPLPTQRLCNAARERRKTPKCCRTPHGPHPRQPELWELF